MARDVNDLMALITKGDEYTETVEVEYMGELFAVQIKPLTDTQLTDVNRQMKISMKMFNTLRGKLQGVAGKDLKDLSEAEKKALEEKVTEDLMNDDTLNLGDTYYSNFILNKLYCQAGIADDRLRALVPKFRYGLTELLSQRIKTISEVPPKAVSDFFGQTQDKPSA